MILEVPLSNIPEKFEMSLNGVSYNIVSRWNDAPEAGWLVDFYDADELPLIMNVPLVSGANLLSQYGYVGIEGLIYVVSDASVYATPTLLDLGTSSSLLYETIP
jgi:hypothetical protein